MPLLRFFINYILFFFLKSTEQVNLYLTPLELDERLQGCYHIDLLLKGAFRTFTTITVLLLRQYHFDTRSSTSVWVHQTRADTQCLRMHQNTYRTNSMHVWLRPAGEILALLVAAICSAAALTYIVRAALEHIGPLMHVTTSACTVRKSQQSSPVCNETS